MSRCMYLVEDLGFGVRGLGFGSGGKGSVVRVEKWGFEDWD